MNAIPLAIGDPPTAALPRRRFLIVRNRHAGTASRRLVCDVIEALHAKGAVTRLLETEREAELGIALAGAREADAVVAAGGDGTLRSLVRTFDRAGISIPIGLIPCGTGNVMAAELAIPRDASALAETLIHGQSRSIAGGRANGELFLAMCGAGFDGEVISRLNFSLKERIGKAAYAPAVFPALSAPPRSFEVVVDGGSARRATWVVAANARHYAGEFVIAPDATPAQAGLHAVLMQAATRAGRLAELLAIARGRAASCPTIECVPCSSLSVMDQDLPIQVDGDYLGRAPLDITAVEHVADLILPHDTATRGTPSSRPRG
ncbi:MAG: diacylglycerol/lipid kinase family protein [Hyphomicrobiaceae bacterium]